MAGHRGQPRRATNLSGTWIDRVHGRRPPDGIILDMDSSESPTQYAAGGLGQERPLPPALLMPAVPVQPVKNIEGALRPGDVHSADECRSVLEPVIARYRGRGLALCLWTRRSPSPICTSGSRPRAIGYAIRLSRPTRSCRSGSGTC